MVTTNPAPKRNLVNYFGINTRSGHANLRYSDNEQTKGQLPRRPVTILNKMEDFFSNNIIAWLVHDWRIQPAYTYPATISESSVHTITPDTPSTGVTIGIAADWASDTPQSVHVGDQMKSKNFDFTIHLGDTYYSGTAPELANNFGSGGEDMGSWPRGTKGSFALAGNHEMFSSGQAWYDMIKSADRGFGMADPVSKIFSGQPAPCFCLITESWCVLGLDTGYQSLKRRPLRISPDNEDLSFPPQMMDWLFSYVKPAIQNRGIVVLTHHQYITAFTDEGEYLNPAKQLKSLTDKEIIWIWGHEHRFSMYAKYCHGPGYITAYGRCIGNGGMPDEHLQTRQVDQDKAKSRGLVLYDHNDADTVYFNIDEDPDYFETFGSNGFAGITINNDDLKIDYYSCYSNGTVGSPSNDRILFTENWKYDRPTDKAIFTGSNDLVSNSDKILTYQANANSQQVGNVWT